nr:MAG TPA: hypothetical protein [Caudoviricetes sp.]
MRLIDADKLNFSEQHYNKSQMRAILDFIDNQPTAYNVDRVVEQLKERSKEFNSGLRLHGKPENMLTYEAIEIVEGRW